MSAYEPEIGQALFGAPAGAYEPPAIAEAALMAVLDELRRVHWNLTQTNSEFGSNDGESYTLGQMEYRSYVWADCDCALICEPNGEEECRGKCLASQPNLSFDGVEFRWYKHARRGLSVNVDWSPMQWSEWLNKALSYLRSAEAHLP